MVRRVVKYIIIILIIFVALYITFRKYMRHQKYIYNYLVNKYSADRTNRFININNKNLEYDLKENWMVIRDEMLKNKNMFTPIRDGPLTKTIIDDDRWQKIHLKRYHEIEPYARELFPKTMKIIDKYHEINIALFSRLEPGCIIKPHCGWFRGGIRIHLSLVTPKDTKNCWINVEGEKYHWDAGEYVSFDDTYEHFVENNTNEERIILLLDVKRKFTNSIMDWVNDRHIDLFSSMQ